MLTALARAHARNRADARTCARLTASASRFSISGSAASSTSPTDLQRCGRDLVERIVGGVPRGVVEVDDVDGGHARLEEPQVVVLNRRFTIEELAPLQPFRRPPDDVGQPARRVRLARDPQIPVPDHVDEDERPDLRERAGLAGGVDVVAAAVGVVGARVPLDDGLFAVEEEELDGQRVPPVLEDAGDFDEERRARSRRRSRRRRRTRETASYRSGRQ